jgi:hypothetical protein
MPKGRMKMKFKKYQHIERFGTDEVCGIEIGETYLFPKIDGTNSSLWVDDDLNIKAGSRNRELEIDRDNAGFFQWAIQQENIKDFFKKYPNIRVYGEWLVPHSLKTYRKDAWRKFYVFDVCIDKDDDFVEYLKYESYKEKLEEFNIDYIPCIAKIKNGSYEQFINCLQHNIFLIEDGKGVGEGIVIKNYNFYNKYGYQTWAKIVTSEFKEKHSKVMGAPEINGKKLIEEEIAKKYCTEALVEKTFEKIKNENGWSSKKIPELLNRVYHDIIQEECWNFVKDNKMPTINFKTLHFFVIAKIKEIKKDILMR